MFSRYGECELRATCVTVDFYSLRFLRFVVRFVNATRLRLWMDRVARRTPSVYFLAFGRRQAQISKQFVGKEPPIRRFPVVDACGFDIDVIPKTRYWADYDIEVMSS